MCLDKVTKIGGSIKNRPRFGYKIVGERKDGTFETWDCTCKTGESHYPLNRWETDTSTGIIGNAGARYPVGFHLYATRTHAVRYVRGRSANEIPPLVVIKCRFSKIVAEGTQDENRVIIARKIMNVGEIKIK